MALNEELGLGLEFLNYYSDLTKKKFTLKEINRVLKRNGTLCLRTPHKFSYMSLISNLLEGSIIKDWLLKKTQPGRKKYFRSFKRC